MSALSQSGNVREMSHSPPVSDYKHENERDDKTEPKSLYVRMLQSRPPKPGMHLHNFSHFFPVLSF